jgi:hypothetical protein
MNAGLRALLMCTWISLVSSPSSLRAQEVPRRIEIHFTPTARAQLAIWIESRDGSIIQTLGLTDAVAYRGIGNRPGALQMNSGWHWPYGRREGVLPVWGHRRAETTGTMFERVIFAGRISEGNASSAGSPSEIINTRDDYYCLSFREGDEALDTMTCASVFMSNKGRYLTSEDAARDYAEPFEEIGGAARMRSLPLGSLYPPRQDLGDCVSCPDHPDVRQYVRDARVVMPELDAVTMATPPPEAPFAWVIDVPETWPDGEYTVFVEANTEGDHAPGWDPSVYPTPRMPAGKWDGWAIGYGYPYRGQPSVVYATGFELSSSGGEYETRDPIGYGDLHGFSGELHAMDESIRNDPNAAKGSGADRLRAGNDGVRLRVVVPPTNICEQPDAPPECGDECNQARPCAEPLICGPDNTCVGRCDVPMQPSAPGEFVTERHMDTSRSHIWAHMRFVVPSSARGLQRYEVRVSRDPITDETSFLAGRPARAASFDDVALTIPVSGEVGSEVAIDLGGLQPETHYWIGIRAVDECNATGEVAVAEVVTTRINFTTVSPCFVATAAYGSALDPRIGSLRRFRDRHLRTNAVGRALVDAYYEWGPNAAEWIRQDEWRRLAARVLLMPMIVFAESID